MPTRDRKLKAASTEPLDPEAMPITGGPPELETGGVLTVDLAAINANWRQLGSRAAPAECAAVVKSDAYGCGLEQVVTRAAASRLQDVFRRRCRRSAPRPRRRAGGHHLCAQRDCAGTAASFASADVRPVIGSLAELAEWDAFRSTSNWSGGAAIHFDTGMNRLGISVEEGGRVVGAQQAAAITASPW